MNLLSIINMFFLVYYIYLSIKYQRKLKDTDSRLQDNEIDYTDLKIKMCKLQTQFDNFKYELENEK